MASFLISQITIFGPPHRCFLQLVTVFPFLFCFLTCLSDMLSFLSNRQRSKRIHSLSERHEKSCLGSQPQTLSFHFLFACFLASATFVAWSFRLAWKGRPPLASLRWHSLAIIAFANLTQMIDCCYSPSNLHILSSTLSSPSEFQPTVPALNNYLP